MDPSNLRHDLPDDDDRISPEKYVDNSGNDAIRTDKICIGKLLSTRPMRSMVVHNVFQHAWAKYGGVRVQELTREVILFEFTNEHDMHDALYLSSWAIQGNLLSLQNWRNESRISEVNFHIVQFWVQIRGLEVDKLVVKMH